MFLLYNARIYTGFKGAAVVNALLIHEDRILAAGSEDELNAIAPAGTARFDMNGKVILPGLTDAHMHLKYYAQGLRNVDAETATIDECLQRVSEKARTTPAGYWITGWGWNQNVWKEGFGNASQLDRAAPQHPVFLSAKSGHAAWVNSQALMLAGIDANTPDPEGGVIQRDTQGNPTGILMETAEHLVSKLVPEPTHAELKAAVLEAQPRLWQMGVTGLHDFSSIDLFPVLEELDQAGSLGLRIVKGIPLAVIEQAAEAGLRSGFGSDYVKIGSVKVFMDGALGPQTAAMLDPFENSKDCGILLIDANDIFEIGQKAASHGLSLAIHAIGDRANREVLDGYERLRAFEKENGLLPPRHRIEHVQLLHPQDYARLARLGITASMQPIHCTSDMHISDRFWGERAAGAYAFKTLLTHKTHLIFGSDAPVEVPNPFVGLHAAVTRRRADGSPGEQGWHPEQRLSLDDALFAYTAAPAIAAGIEKRLGTLSSGNYADLIVLEQDPFEIQAQDLHLLTPDATMVGGTWVWNKAGY